MRGPLLVLTWIVATALATGLAWAGVRSVADNVAAPLPVPAATTGQADPSERPPAGEVTPDPGASEPVSEPPFVQSEPAQPTETVRTFELYGGAATVRFSAARVDVLSAVPNPGFSADVERQDGSVRVEFESDDHRSRLDAWWNGEPQHDIEEQDDDGGNSGSGNSGGGGNGGGGGPGEDGGDGGGDHDD